MNTAVVVIGAGPVGVRAVEEISALNPDVSISLYGDEPYAPYNRVKLSHYLAGSDDFDSLRVFPRVDPRTEFNCFYGCGIVKIDSDKKCVYRADGNLEHYDKLVLATGSHAHVPHLDNTALDGVFTLRSIADAETLKARDSRIVVILGGGLLGLETARALQSHGNKKVIVVDHAPYLMSRQLNREAGDLLLEKVLRLGIEVSLSSGLRAINGQHKLESITLRNGRVIACDTLVFAVGIRPNIELARRAGIATRHGIVVNEALRTSAADVYAVGECAEYKQANYGIVAPGLEQAGIMAANLCGRKKRYNGSQIATRLKVLDYPVFSMGRVGENEPGRPYESLTFEEPMQYIYRHLVVHRWRLIGCIALGEWGELSRIRNAIERKRRIWPWQLRRFRRTGLLWDDKSVDSVCDWPDAEVVCHCNQVTRGQLAAAIDGGCKTLAALSAATRAGTTCDSCNTLLSDFLNSQMQTVKAFKTMLLYSLLLLSAGLLGTLVVAGFLFPTGDGG